MHTTPPDRDPVATATAAPEPARAGSLLRRARVLLLVLLDTLVSAALCSRRVLRRLPDAPARDGGAWGLLAMLYVLSGSWSQASATDAMAGPLSALRHGAWLLVLFAFTPQRLRHHLALYLVAASGAALLWGALDALGAFGPAQPLHAVMLFGWQMLATLALLQHRQQALAAPTVTRTRR